MLRLLLPRRKGDPCPNCQSDQGETPGRGFPCAKHQEMDRRSLRARTSWKALITLKPTGSAFYMGIDDRLDLCSEKKFNDGKTIVILPMRTTAQVELNESTAANDLVITNHGGQTWTVRHLKRESSRRLYQVNHQRMQDHIQKSGQRPEH